MTNQTPSRRSFTDELRRWWPSVSRLQEGWRGPGSHPISTVAFGRLVEVSREVSTLDFHVDLTPLADGGVHLEWRHDGFDFSAEVGADGSLFLYRLDESSDDDVSTELSQFDAPALLRLLEVGEL